MVEIKEKEYLWAAEGDDGYIELLLDLKETIGHLQVHLRKVLRLQDKVAEKQRPLEISDEQANMRVKLPKLNLLMLDGDLLHWQELWDIFNTTVNQRRIPDVSKFSYLKNSLQSAAASAVCGISVINDNYPTVI